MGEGAHSNAFPRGTEDLFTQQEEREQQTETLKNGNSHMLDRQRRGATYAEGASPLPAFPSLPSTQGPRRVTGT